MNIDFIKLHTCSNDFILVDASRQELPEEGELQRLASLACRRHRGIGANGLVTLRREEDSVRMRVFLPNGEETDIGNDALICVGRYAFDSGMLGKEDLTVRGGLGTRSLQAVDSTHFRLRIGMPYTFPGGEELTELPNEEYVSPLMIHGQRIQTTPVNVQRNFAVVFDYPERKAEARRLSRQIVTKLRATAPVCPAFVRVYSREEIAMVRYSRKRPVDNGSMASAATVAAVVNGFADRYVEVHCDGGSLFVQWLDRDNTVYVTGTAEYAFSGSYYFEERRSAL